MMKITVLAVTALVLLLAGAGVAPAQDLSKEEWQRQMDTYAKQRDELSAQIKNLEGMITSLEAQNAQASAEYQKALDDLYALVGSNRAAAEAYGARLAELEAKASELQRLSDAELLARSGEVTQLSKDVKAMWENKLSLIPEYWDRLTALNEQVNSLNTTLGGSSKIYTVGTWARDRDCLWNISKKPEIYDNAFLWPKIWQGNRDQIKDPDLIYPGQKLTIPPKADLTPEERQALKRYRSRRVPLP